MESKVEKSQLIDNQRLKKPDLNGISYVISVKIYPGCYRHIRIDGNETLYELAWAILDSFGFDNDHLSEFCMNNIAYDPSACYGVSLMPGMPMESEYNAADYKLNDFNFQKGKKFIYVFDFGDDWRFKCTVLRILHEPTKGWEVVRSVGKNPEQYGYYDYDDDF